MINRGVPADCSDPEFGSQLIFKLCDMLLAVSAPALPKQISSLKATQIQVALRLHSCAPVSLEVVLHAISALKIVSRSDHTEDPTFQLCEPESRELLLAISHEVFGSSLSELRGHMLVLSVVYCLAVEAISFLRVFSWGGGRQPLPTRHLMSRIWELLFRIAQHVDISARESGASERAVHRDLIRGLDLMIESDREDCRKRILDVTGGTKRVCILHTSAEFESPYVLELLLSAGPSIEVRDKFGRTPLLVAAKCRNSAAVEQLLKSRANIGALDAQGESAMLILTRSTQCATESRRCIECITAILNGTPAPLHAEILNCAHPQKQLMTPLMMAAQSGCIDMCQFLLARRAKASHTDIHGRCALWYSARACKGEPRILEMLLSSDHVIEEMRSRINSRLAESTRSSPPSAALEKRGAPSGYSLLHFAVWQCHSDICELLVRHKASVNAADAPEGWTALKLAAVGGKYGHRLLHAKVESRCCAVESELFWSAPINSACPKCGKPCLWGISLPSVKKEARRGVLFYGQPAEVFQRIGDEPSFIKVQDSRMLTLFSSWAEQLPPGEEYVDKSSRSVLYWACISPLTTAANVRPLLPPRASSCSVRMAHKGLVSILDRMRAWGACETRLYLSYKEKSELLAGLSIQTSSSKVSFKQLPEHELPLGASDPSPSVLSA
jgi:hypothetical protein